MGKLAFVISTQVHEKIQLAAMMASIHATVGGNIKNMPQGLAKATGCQKC
jgi:hypothetical protein